MGEDKSFEKFRLEAQKINIAPPQRSWYKLQRKLKKHDGSVKPRSYKLSFLMSIAAIGVILIASIMVLNHQTRNMQDLPKGKIVEWETLDSGDDYILSKDQVKSLYAAYAKQAGAI